MENHLVKITRTLSKGVFYSIILFIHSSILIVWVSQSCLPTKKGLRAWASQSLFHQNSSHSFFKLSSIDSHQSITHTLILIKQKWSLLCLHQLFYHKTVKLLQNLVDLDVNLPDFKNCWQTTQSTTNTGKIYWWVISNRWEILKVKRSQDWRRSYKRFLLLWIYFKRVEQDETIIAIYLPQTKLHYDHVREFLTSLWRVF